MISLHKTLLALCLSALAIVEVESFAPRIREVRSRSTSSSSSSALHFGIPSLFTPKDDDTDKSAGDSNKEEKKIGAAGLLQLITAGMGAPFLGDFEGVDEETGKMMFTLEANNLVDEQGRSKQTQMPYFESGWVDPEDERRAAEGGFKFPWQK